MSGAYFSPASQRNCEPILGVLRHEFAASRRVLEIGAGCGYHVIRFAHTMPWLVWQPSDVAGQVETLAANLKAVDVSNVQPPLTIDMRDAQAASVRYDALYTANTAHIMSMDGVRGMFGFAGDALQCGGVIACYGPFRRNGAFNTASNAEFDRALRGRDPESGIRDLGALDEIAARESLLRLRVYAMPSNNLLVVWEKSA